MDKSLKVGEYEWREREKIREDARRKILKELRKEKHDSYSSHNSCKSLSEEFSDYYRGKHRSLLQPTIRKGHEKADTMGQNCLSPRQKMSGVATNVYLRKTLEKPK